MQEERPTQEEEERIEEEGGGEEAEEGVAKVERDLADKRKLEEETRERMVAGRREAERRIWALNGEAICQLELSFS